MTHGEKKYYGTIVEFDDDDDHSEDSLETPNSGVQSVRPIDIFLIQKQNKNNK